MPHALVAYILQLTEEPVIEQIGEFAPNTGRFDGMTVRMNEASSSSMWYRVGWQINPKYELCHMECEGD